MINDIEILEVNIKNYGTKENKLLGYLTEPFIQEKIENLSSITFHISNFLWFNICNRWDGIYDKEGNETRIQKQGWFDFEGQFIFDYDDWHIVLATLEDNYELQEKLERRGGYGITHICKIERLDNQQFNLDQAYEIIDAFIYYLSFVRGIWVAPFVVLGFDEKGTQILGEWRNPAIKADSWQSLAYSWTRSDTTEMVDIFPGFMKKWQDETWHEVIQNIIQWYIESYKHTNGHNTSIILVQAALEKLAWTYLNTNNFKLFEYPYRLD